MLKRFLSIILASLTLLGFAALSGCSDKPAVDGGDTADAEYGSSSYAEMVEAAFDLVRTGDTALMKKIYPKEELEVKVADYEAKGQDFYELLAEEFEACAARYAEVCGEDWQLSYVFTDVREKDEAGVQNYREFDEYYFRTFGLDPEKITAATYVYADVTVSGSLGSFTKQKSCWLFFYEGRWYSFYIPSFGLNIAGKE